MGAVNVQLLKGQWVQISTTAGVGGSIIYRGEGKTVSPIRTTEQPAMPTDGLNDPYTWRLLRKDDTAVHFKMSATDFIWGYAEQGDVLISYTESGS